MLAPMKGDNRAHHDEGCPGQTPGTAAARHDVDGRAMDPASADQVRGAARAAWVSRVRALGGLRPVWHAADLPLLALAVVLVMAVAAGIGSVHIPPAEVAGILLRRLPFVSRGAGPTWWPASHEAILLQVRLPRILLSAMVGASLSVAGAALQGLLRNPLADPYVAGVSAGAGLGATIAMVAGVPLSVLGVGSVPILAFITAVATMVVVYSIARVSGRLPTDTFLLAGVVVGSFLWAVISFLLVVSGDTLREAMMWLMGSLSGRGYAHVKMAFPYMAAGIAALVVLARDFNLISLGDEEARYLGLDPEEFKRVAILAASLVTAAAVSVGGIIGFVGLVVPHTMRLILGPDHKVLMPACVFAGAGFLVAADTLARVVIAPGEIPVGVITALAGGPFFLYLLRRRKTSGAL
ncbi:MAG: FecCD family ABC transporter permease [Bacteroidota bacterium]